MKQRQHSETVHTTQLNIQQVLNNVGIQVNIALKLCNACSVCITISRIKLYTYTYQCMNVLSLAKNSLGSTRCPAIVIPCQNARVDTSTTVQVVVRDKPAMKNFLNARNCHWACKLYSATRQHVMCRHRVVTEHLVCAFKKSPIELLLCKRQLAP
jgi:hypothetical protein